jgi:DNA-binding IclR family transcriptional regulator
MTQMIDIERPIEDDAVGDERTSSSVRKALTILDIFQGASSVLGVTEIARMTGLPKSTAFRLLTMIEAQGFVERRGSGYCLGRRLFELGNQVAWCRPRNLRDTALPFMCELYKATQRVVHLAVLEGTDVLYLEKLQGHDAGSIPTRVGGRVAARTTALGKAMLAYSHPDVVEQALNTSPLLHTGFTIVLPRLFEEELNQVRRTGIAYDREEVRLGLRCVAAPIFRRGEVLGAVSVCGLTGQFDPVAAAPRVIATAKAIGKAMGS